MDMGKNKIRHSAADAPAPNSSPLFPAQPGSIIPENWEPSRAHAGLSAHLHPPSPSSHPPFFFFPFFQILRHNCGVLEASSHISRAHRSPVRDWALQVEPRSQSCTDAPRHVRMGLSCHKPAHGVWVGLLHDGNQC